jgi:hypothetical protein
MGHATTCAAHKERTSNTTALLESGREEDDWEAG